MWRTFRLIKHLLDELLNLNKSAILFRTPKGLSSYLCNDCAEKIADCIQEILDETWKIEE